MYQKITFIGLLLIGLSGCNTDDVDDSTTTGNWTKQSDFEGVTRSAAISFSIGEYAYVGLGTDGDEYLKDLWRYDPNLNFWEEMAPFEGPGRISAVAFSTGGKGYVATGYNGDLETEELDDLWEYDPQANSWTEKSRFEGGPRYAAVAFVIGDRGYVGTGYNGNFLKDFWVYNPDSDTWTQTISLYGSKRESAIAFVVDEVAYVGAGRNNGSYVYDFWAFDPTQEGWTDLTLYSEDDTYEEYILALTRHSAVAFELGGLGYIATGVADSYSSAVFSFNPSTNEWSNDFTPFEGSPRSEATAFNVQGRVYIATGRNSSFRFDDIWSFQPEEEYDEFN